jgi:hypothetical protein
MSDSKLRSYLQESTKPIDLRKNDGMRALMAMKSFLHDPKTPHAIKFAAAEMAIDKVEKITCWPYFAATNYLTMLFLFQCASHCQRLDRASDHNECAARCSDDFKAACEKIVSYSSSISAMSPFFPQRVSQFSSSIEP